MKEKETEEKLKQKELEKEQKEQERKLQEELEKKKNEKAAQSFINFFVKKATTEQVRFFIDCPGRDWNLRSFVYFYFV